MFSLRNKKKMSLAYSQYPLLSESLGVAAHLQIRLFLELLMIKIELLFLKKNKILNK